MTKTWLPLESNPDVMNDYVSKMGLDLSKIQFHDVMSTEEWALEMIPRPVLGVLMLFPIKKLTEDYSAEERKRIEEHGQICSENVYHMKQTVGNACGTVGILHAIANSRAPVTIGGETLSYVHIAPKSYLESFFASTNQMSSDQIAAYLETDEEVGEIHSSAAEEGQSEAPENIDVDTHFVCFSHVDGCLYELDGRKACPINHGPCTQETLLEGATAVVKKFMERDPEEVRFTIIALAASLDESE